MVTQTLMLLFAGIGSSAASAGRRGVAHRRVPGGRSRLVRMGLASDGG
jgi:hypothetical protein